MANKTLQKAVMVSLCLALLFVMSHAQVTQADAPSEVNEVFVELAPGIIEEIVTEEAVLPDPRKCVESVGKVTTCIFDILQNLGKGKLNFISPKCCEGLAAISDQCWNTLLPFNAVITGIIKNICSGADASPPTKVL